MVARIETHRSRALQQARLLVEEVIHQLLEYPSCVRAKSGNRNETAFNR
jgi:hypothetical protein